MGQFGEKLRAEREARGIELEDISVKTRVSVRLLEAIESEKFELLPGGVFNLAFIRQYSRCVGLDEDEIAAEFNQLARPKELEVGDPGVSADGSVQAHERGATLAENVTEYLRQYRRMAVGAIVVVLVATIAAMLYSGGSHTELPAPPAAASSQAESPPAAELEARDRAPSPPDVQPENPTAGDAWPVRTASPAPAQEPIENSEAVSSETNAVPPSSPAVSSPLIVEISVTAKVWIQAVADGERVFESIFEEGETKSIAAHDFVRLVVGNAAGLTVAVNGKTMPPIGPSGHVRRVVVTPRGMEIDRIEPNRPPGRDAVREHPLETRAVEDRFGPGVPAAADRELFPLTTPTRQS